MNDTNDESGLSVLAGIRQDLSLNAKMRAVSSTTSDSTVATSGDHPNVDDAEATKKSVSEI